MMKQTGWLLLIAALALCACEEKQPQGTASVMPPPCVKPTMTTFVPGKAGTVDGDSDEATISVRLKGMSWRALSETQQSAYLKTATELYRMDATPEISAKLARCMQARDAYQDIYRFDAGQELLECVKNYLPVRCDFSKPNTFAIPADIMDRVKPAPLLGDGVLGGSDGAAWLAAPVEERRAALEKIDVPAPELYDCVTAEAARPNGDVIKATWLLRECHELVDAAQADRSADPLSEANSLGRWLSQTPAQKQTFVMTNELRTDNPTAADVANAIHFAACLDEAASKLRPDLTILIASRHCVDKGALR